MIKPKLSDKEQVTEYIDTLEHPLKDVVSLLRDTILGTSPEIAEQIKWNAPAFYYTGAMAPFDPKEYKRDMIVMHLRKKDLILLVFPTGAKIKDTSGLLEGDYADGRRMVTIKSAEDFEMKKGNLQVAIKQWIDLIEQ